jgi:hypothetical protein
VLRDEAEEMEKLMATVRRKRGFKTAGELLDKIKGEWRRAAIAVSNSIGSPQPITRISFHENQDGGLLVMFHEDASKVAITDSQDAAT